ncbi:polymorphic toxin-type HINT domain-containing protein [Roseiconus lacunae]|uniref:Polymorphic toxin-type HINT domain-containing protein n=1 Tax=Roseiconus lacunae TaxID=2605694 RepID=A0ABT7PSB8_9BACT|nr:polymorphic toxin-type HINT domain-containing protein [Roseiconus lacunae]MDM4019405.1 polymorphic toxin-type HINT domain-containing protein [Roseiconus lacunae]
MLVSVLGMRYPVDAMQSQISHDHYRRVRLLGLFLGVAGLVFAACLIVQWAGQASKSPKSGEQPVGLLPTNLAPSLGRLPSTKPIEEIRVGDRVLSRNPEVTDAERARWQDPDWEDWLHLRLVMAKDDGSELHIELLRPESWVLERLSYVTDDRVSASTAVGTIANVTLASPQVRRPLTPKGSKRATRIDSDPLSPLRPFYRDLMLTSAELATSGTDLIGITVALDLPEMGAVGTAYVTAFDPCPPISKGAGQPVTATFAHRSSTEVLDIIFEGEDEPIGVTDNHLFWSVDDQRFVPIGEMNVGDRVQTYSGDTKRIAGKLPRPGPQAVYNLEVYGEHVYFVGQQGILAHNLYEVNGNIVYSDALDELLPRTRLTNVPHTKAGNHSSLSRSRGNLESDVQLHHLNQHAIYGNVSVIPGNTGIPIRYADGAVVPVRGQATTPGSQHNILHVQIERFLDDAAEAQRITGRPPTNGQYGDVVYHSLRKAGFSPKEAYRFASSARRQRIANGHLDDMPIPRYSNPVPNLNYRANGLDQ